jgi:peptidoglycan/xylan/chitin deacetylase (PgdA/CDA1 family)
MEATKRCRSVVIFAIFFGMACLPAKAVDKAMVTFTFDDGYRSLYTRALPALSRYGYPATAYIISGNVGDGYAVTWSHLWQLYWNYGWEIGNHTQYHPDLTTLLCAQSDFSIIQEIRGARSDLEKHGLLNVTSLAYPYGSFDVMTGGGNTDVVGLRQK